MTEKSSMVTWDGKKVFQHKSCVNHMSLTNKSLVITLKIYTHNHNIQGNTLYIISNIKKMLQPFELSSVKFFVILIFIYFLNR